MVKQDILSLFKVLLHLRADLRLLNIIRPVKIIQIQVACAPPAHALGLQDKALALRIHNIQRSLLVVKPVRQGFVNGIVNIFGVESPNFLPIPQDRALYGIGPRPHIIHI